MVTTIARGAKLITRSFFLRAFPGCGIPRGDELSELALLILITVIAK